MSYIFFKYYLQTVHLKKSDKCINRIRHKITNKGWYSIKPNNLTEPNQIDTKREKSS